jgi:hypothetical protein
MEDDLNRFYGVFFPEETDPILNRFGVFRPLRELLEILRRRGAGGGWQLPGRSVVFFDNLLKSLRQLNDGFSSSPQMYCVLSWTGHGDVRESNLISISAEERRALAESFQAIEWAVRRIEETFCPFVGQERKQQKGAQASGRYEKPRGKERWIVLERDCENGNEHILASGFFDLAKNYGKWVKAAAAAAIQKVKGHAIKGKKRLREATDYVGKVHKFVKDSKKSEAKRAKK